MSALDKLCHGCLCSDRKMLPLVNHQKRLCFFTILNEMPLVNSDNIPIWLCWECGAIISKLAKFKEQVKNAHNTLNSHIIMGLSVADIPYIPHLLTQKQVTISYPDLPEEEQVKIKYESETPPEMEVKQEMESDPYSDDDKVLIEFASKKQTRCLANGKKKKRKKKILETYRVVKLSLEEVREERRLIESKEEYLNAMFPCKDCLVSFPNADDLKDHITNKHEMNTLNYKCEVCKCTFKVEVSYKYHMNKHLLRYECSMCGERSGSKRAATAHYEMVHCHRSELEYEIQNKAVQNDDLKKSVDIENSVDSGGKEEAANFPCESCAKVFRWKTSLRKHAETHRIETGQKRRPYCESCKLSFTTTANLQKHVKTSSKHQIQLKLRKLQETLTEESTPDKQAAHIEQIKSSVISSRQLHRCPQCDKSFQWRGNLLRHLHSHAARANGELICEPCNRTFSSIATYKQHMSISKKHVSENDFKYMCSECGRKFADKTRLKDHMNWEHLKNYVHTCLICQKVFKSHTSLYLHKQVVHKKNGVEHLCDHCGKPFPNQAKLRSHITAVHSGAQPYRCPECPARFSWHSCLARHVRRGHRAQQ